MEIDRRKLILPEPIKTIGEHDVPLKLHREVTVPLKVQVAQGRARGVAARRRERAGTKAESLEDRRGRT